MALVAGARTPGPSRVGLSLADRAWLRMDAPATRLVPERILRTRGMFLPGCRGAFAEAILSVGRTLAAKPNPSGAWPAPLTREEMLGPEWTERVDLRPSFR